MSVRQRKKALDTVYTHFKEFELPLDIEYKSYQTIIGRNALSALSVRRHFRAWKYLLHALKGSHPDLLTKLQEPVKDTESVIPKQDPLASLRASTTEK